MKLELPTLLIAAWALRHTCIYLFIYFVSRLLRRTCFLTPLTLSSSLLAFPHTHTSLPVSISSVIFFFLNWNFFITKQPNNSLLIFPPTNQLLLLLFQIFTTKFLKNRKNSWKTMLDFGEELTRETLKIPWLIWIQIIVLLLLVILLYCFSLFPLDLSQESTCNNTNTSTTLPSSSSSSSAPVVLKQNTTTFRNHLQPSQVWNFFNPFVCLPWKIL